MATWKEQEISVLRNCTARKLTDEVLTQLEADIPNRSRAAIKKKFLETRAGGTGATTGKFVPWTQEELRLLEREYSSALHLKTKKARVSAILDKFPGRTLKAIETKLREEFSVLYHLKPGQQPPIREVEDDDLLPPPPTPSPPPATTPSPRTPVPLTSTASSPATTTTTTQLTTPCPPTTIVDEDLQRQYRKALTLTYSKSRPKKLIRFYTNFHHRQTIKDIDVILEAELASICEKIKSPAKQHKASKHAILAAGYLLRLKIVGSMGKLRRKPFYKNTEEKIAKLKRRVEVASELQQRGEKPVSQSQKNEAQVMKKLRMTPAQYIKTTQDRVERFESRLREEKSRYEVISTRLHFQGQPSMRSIRNPTKSASGIDWSKAGDFYRELYKPSVEHESPWFENWLTTIRGRRRGRSTPEMEMPDLDPLLQEALRHAAPWKAPGEDEVPTALYKTFPAAKQYLFSHAKRTIHGQYKMTREDVQANTILIYKTGDATDPNNYRPIALLNTDYKIITKVINAVVKNAVGHVIPHEQMSRAGVWGTMHGLLLDKAATQTARMRRSEHHTAWYDFRKAFDTVCHGKIRRLVGALPIPTKMKDVVLRAISQWNICLSPPQGPTIRIPVKRGVYQGDSLSPLLFILTTSSIIQKIKEDPMINRLAKGRQEIVAYMDDIKCHAPNIKSIKAITSTLEECSRQLGLELNLGKCGHYCRRLEENDDVDHIPAVRNGYKYLGLIQTECDTNENYDVIESKVTQKANEILSSHLSTAQKRRLFNSCVIPTAVYVTGNMHPNTSVLGTLKRCRNLDLKIRKMMVAHNIKTRPTSNQRAYLPHTIGGLGFRTIETETEIQYARKYAYLRTHPELRDTLEKYQKLDAAGCRTPLGDFRHVTQKYNLEVPDIAEFKPLSAHLVKAIKDADLEARYQDWSKAMHYPQLVLADRHIISFPAAQYFRTDSSKLSLINAAAEEQLHQLRAAPGNDGNRKCRRGCPEDETAYHVASSCQAVSYNARHDHVVYWLLRTILEKTNAPEEIKKQLHFGKAVLNVEYEIPGGRLRIRAGQSILTELPLHHNKPDVMVQILAQEKKTFLFEVSIPHLQNYHTQEGIKRVKYAKNSMVNVSHRNYKTVHRDQNLVDVLSHAHRCEVQLGLLIIGCFGEVLETEEHQHFCELLHALGIQQHAVQTLIQKASYSVITETSKILMNRLRR